MQWEINLNWKQTTKITALYSNSGDFFFPWEDLRMWVNWRVILWSLKLMMVWIIWNIFNEWSIEDAKKLWSNIITNLFKMFRTNEISRNFLQKYCFKSFFVKPIIHCKNLYEIYQGLDSIILLLKGNGSIMWARKKISIKPLLSRDSSHIKKYSWV